MIKVLIVDDSPTECELLRHILENEPDIEVVGCAKNGAEAIEKTERLKPNLITMDIKMPIMDGLEATRYIMSHFPVPIIIISGKLNDSDMDLTYQALALGAVSVIAKPFDVVTGFSSIQRNIVDMVRSMSEIKVIKRRFNMVSNQKSVLAKPTSSSKAYEVIAIGASVGGPQALTAILSKLPADFSLPIVVVQHMTRGFMTGFTTWLNNNIPATVKDASNHEVLKKGVIYFAPDHTHLTIERSYDGLITKLIESNPVAGFCPSATVLFRSIAKSCGKNGIGILLTGMGHDGADGLLDLKKVNGHTIIQDEKSAIVFGMAGVAKSLGAVDKEIELEKIADYLIDIAKSHGKE
jgi:two-component system chemotaxis response regulator CheB